MSKHGNLKRGTVREDGKIFLCYTQKGSERWLTKDHWDEVEAARKERVSRDRHKSIERQRIDYHKRKDIYLKRGKEWRKNNKHKYKACKKKYREKNQEKEKMSIRAWKIANKENVRQYQKNYYKERFKKDPLFKLNHNIRGLISSSFKRFKFNKRSRTKNILGCCMEEFKAHIESQFLNGMSWENRNEWHLDHIMPVSMAKTEDELIRLNHYKNFRPLWAMDNLVKSDKTPEILVLF